MLLPKIAIILAAVLLPTSPSIAEGSVYYGNVSHLKTTTYQIQVIPTKPTPQPVLISAEVQPKKTFIGVWSISRYYTPVKGQKRYYNKSYSRDYRMNCSGDCLVTGSGYRLSEKDVFKIVACPKTLPFGTKLEIEDIGLVICEDRGGAIKGKRLDLWAGIGDTGINNIYGHPETTGKKKVYKIE